MQKSYDFLDLSSHLLVLKKVDISEASILTELAKKTFVETFAKDNQKKDMDMYVAETFNLERQLSEINDPNRFIEIAWIENQPAGFLHLLKGNPDPAIKGPKPLEILRLYADSKWHGKGVGSALMERSLQLAREQGFQTIWLGVWEKNHRALAFYKKYGFEVVGQHGFLLGTDHQIDIVMARGL